MTPRVQRHLEDMGCLIGARLSELGIVPPDR
jgi:hypothetical protein